MPLDLRSNSFSSLSKILLPIGAVAEFKANDVLYWHKNTYTLLSIQVPDAPTCMQLSVWVLIRRTDGFIFQGRYGRPLISKGSHLPLPAIRTLASSVVLGAFRHGTMSELENQLKCFRVLVLKADRYRIYPHFHQHLTTFQGVPNEQTETKYYAEQDYMPF